MIKRELGNFERAQVWVSELFPFNAVTVLQVINGPAEKVLAEALIHLQARHPLLRSCVREEKKGKKKHYYFDFQETLNVPLTVIDRQGEQQWIRISEEMLDKPVDLFSGPMMKVTYLYGEEISEIIITFQHLILDATSGSWLLDELLNLCSAIGMGEVINDTPIAEPQPATRRLFPEPFRGFRLKWRILSFLKRQMKDELSFMWRSRGIRKPPVYMESRNKILSFILSEHVTATLIKRSRKKRITINDLCNAAIMKAVQKHRYNGVAMPMRNFNFADLRPYLDPPVEPHVLGSYFTIMRFTVGMEENPETWELARKIGKITYASLKRGDKFCANLLSPVIVKSMLSSKSSRMSEAAISFTGRVNVAGQYGDKDGIQVEAVHAYVSNYGLGPEYTAHVRLFDNCFYWNILYLDCDMDESMAETIKNEIKTILEQAAIEEKV